MFEVGKKVICIRDSANECIKKGQIFELLAITKTACRCPNVIDLDVGIRSDNEQMECNNCGYVSRRKDSIVWIDSKLFASYDDSLSKITADDLIEELETALLTTQFKN